MISHTGKAWGFLLCVLFVSSFAHAQLLTGLERPLNLTMTPTYPVAGDAIHFSVQSYGVDLDRSSIVWYADGKEIARGNGLREAEATAGALGSATKITVVAEEPNGLIGSAEAVIRPTEVDLLWHADSYAPPYFRGRVFAGAGSTIRAQAIVRFVNADKTVVAENNIVYQWYVDSTQIATGRGRSSVSLPAPTIFGNATLTVIATSVDGIYRGQASTRIASTDPVLELYENHPLFGILYHRALVGSATTLEREQKVTAIPYFAHISDLNDSDLVYAWNAEGLALQADTEHPETLTVTTSGYAGPVDISLSLTSMQNWFLKAEGSWELIFAEGTTIFDRLNPFAPNP